jgi:catechol 2,3-dioxygenase-like lactoylglutathione lyase family enzyme
MDARISIVTLGVADLDRSLRFYRDGLGLPTSKREYEGIVFFRTKGAVLALYPYDALAKDVSESFTVPRSKFPGITLAHNVNTRPEVDAILARAAAAGARIEKPAQIAEWGGYSGYFSDPDGYLWEVACGTSPLAPDGSVDVA